ncbi:uncharacterized protein ISCGN_023474 [Ixodes scapularis]
MKGTRSVGRPRALRDANTPRIICAGSMDVKPLYPVLETSHVCSRYEIRLRCDTDHLVAVHEAFFASGSQSQPWPATPDCEPKTRASDRPPCVEDLRQALNSRCSGAVHCLFVLSRDHADRRCRGDGSLVVRYRCLPEKRVNKLCSVPLRQREGYLSSPGFPHYYPALTDCVWHLEAAQGQTVHVQMLDVSMRRPAPGPQDCVQDLVSVSEGSNPLLVACGEELRNLRSVQSVSNRLEVRFRASEFVPNRGFLLRYRLVGCPTPGPPHQGYLVHRTPSSAEYKCCRDHVFADTLRDTRTLHCVDGNAWNDSVPDCVSRLELALNGTLLAAEDDPGASDQALKHRSEMHLSSLADILVPCLIMGGLLLGNAVVVLVIFRLRKRRIARLRARLPTVALLADGESKEPPPAQRPQA